MKLPIALQLYTVRDEIKKDFIGTLEKVAKMGYQGVEFAGFGDISASKMNTTLKRLNLKAIASHTAKNLLLNKLDEIIAFNIEIGNEFIICSYDEYDSKEGWLDAIKLYSEIGRKLKKKGLSFGYHNHAHELEKYNGEYILDIIYSHTDPKILIAELDTYWLYYAGVDPVDYIKKYADRCVIIHLKDMRADDKDTTEIGEGIIDIKSIIKASEDACTKWLVVEQDNFRRPSLESAKISLENIMKM